jgi:hypothetical protein
MTRVHDQARVPSDKPSGPGRPDSIVSRTPPGMASCQIRTSNTPTSVPLLHMLPGKHPRKAPSERANLTPPLCRLMSQVGKAPISSVGVAAVRGGYPGSRKLASGDPDSGKLQLFKRTCHTMGQPRTNPAKNVSGTSHAYIHCEREARGPAFFCCVPVCVRRNSANASYLSPVLMQMRVCRRPGTQFRPSAERRRRCTRLTWSSRSCRPNVERSNAACTGPSTTTKTGALTLSPAASRS